MSEVREFSYSSPGDEAPMFSNQEIKDYRRACEQLGLRLSEVTERVINAGKVPTIIIPSRGMIPIFITALNYLRSFDDKVVRDHEFKFYPTELYNDDTSENDGYYTNDTTVDVVYYSFTADSSIVAQDRRKELESKIRNSAVDGVVSLLYGDKKDRNLRWYLYMLGKLDPAVLEGFGMTSKEMIDRFASIVSDSDRELILIDTVQSGRAISQILGAFDKKGHKATPLLAVDNKSGKKMMQKYRTEVLKHSSMEYTGNVEEENLFLLPLITEDKGASVLGVNALAIKNFSEDGLFHRLKPGVFTPDFLPQSCLWIPPQSKGREAEADIFAYFLKRVRGGEDFLDLSEEEKDIWEAELKSSLTGNRSSHKPFGRRVFVGSDKSVQTLTGSGIIQLDLSDDEIQRMVNEFSKSFRK